MAAAPATNCSSISAYATAWLPLVLRHAALIWSTIACTASPTALSSSGISSTICIVGHPPSLGLLLPLRCHGSAPLSTATPLCFLIALRLLLRIGATPQKRYMRTTQLYETNSGDSLSQSGALLYPGLLQVS